MKTFITISTVMNAITAAFNLFVCVFMYANGVADAIPYIVCLTMAALCGAVVFFNLRHLE